LAALTGAGMAWAAVPYDAGQVEAEITLGRDGFTSWAVRGWFAAMSE
jgi:hypothetical protein